MEAKDTVINAKQIEGIRFKFGYSHDYSIVALIRRVAEKQAEISFEAGKQEGRQEVVEWLEAHMGYVENWNLAEIKQRWLDTGAWQAQLKVWFKDNLRLLKKWGIR